MATQGTEQPLRAADTNVVIRLIVADDPEQTKLAEAELARGFVILHGVVMEAEWVLRSFYGFNRQQIGGAIRELLDHQNVLTSEAESVRWAVERYLSGADLADMLHVIAAAPYGEFASFEKRLATEAGVNPPARIVHLK